MWVIVVTSAMFDTEIIGPFETVEQARFFEDRYVDAPEGARADFVEMTSATELYAKALADSEERG